MRGDDGRRSNCIPKSGQPGINVIGVSDILPNFQKESLNGHLLSLIVTQTTMFFKVKSSLGKDKNIQIM